MAIVGFLRNIHRTAVSISAFWQPFDNIWTLVRRSISYSAAFVCLTFKTVTLSKCEVARKASAETAHHHQASFSRGVARTNSVEGV